MKDIRKKMNYSIEIINAIEHNDINQSNALIRLFDNLPNDKKFNVDNMLLMYFRNIFFNKKFEMLNETFYYFLENLKTFKHENIHLYYSIWYNIATSHPTDTYNLKNLVALLETQPDIANCLNDYDFQCLISTLVCQDKIELVNRVNRIMLGQKDENKIMESEQYIQ